GAMSRPAPSHQTSGLSHRGCETEHSGNRGGCAIERPVESPEGDHTRAKGGLHVDDDLAETKAAAGGGSAERPEDDDVRPQDEQQAPEHWLLAQSRGPVLQLMQARAPGDEALNRPPYQPEQPQLLRGWWVHRQAVDIFGIALRLAHLIGVATVPDRALA